MSMRLIDRPDVARTWQQFRAFYAELVAAKQAAAMPAAVGPSAAGDAAGAADDGEARLAGGIFSRLHRVLGELGYGRRAQAPGHAAGIAEIDPGYVMAALADEVFLHLVDWTGRDAWPSMLLEESLYGTRIAGERIIAAAERLAREGAASRPELALVILLSLELGFRGRYRGIDDRGTLALLRELLYEALAEEPADRPIDWKAMLPAARGPILDAEGIRLLPPLRPWLWTLAAVIALYLVASHLLWTAGVSDVLAGADRVIEAGHPDAR